LIQKLEASDEIPLNQHRQKPIPRPKKIRKNLRLLPNLPASPSLSNYNKNYFHKSQKELFLSPSISRCPHEFKSRITIKVHLEDIHATVEPDIKEWEHSEEATNELSAKGPIRVS
jgi:hypothetical protein